MKLDIVGGKEIAGRLSVPPNTVHQWSKRRLLPDPEGTVSGQPAWSWQTIEQWARATGRLPGIRDAVLDELRTQPRETSDLAGVLVARGLARSVSHVSQTLDDLRSAGLVEKATPTSWVLTITGIAALRARAVSRRGEGAEPMPSHRAAVVTHASGSGQ